jgi:hypothetical protein
MSILCTSNVTLISFSVFKSKTNCIKLKLRHGLYNDIAVRKNELRQLDSQPVIKLI